MQGTWNRFVLSLRAFWRILTDPEFAARVEPLFSRAPTGPDLRVLAVLQRDGRLIDFLQEELDGYTDAQIGAAVRDIHRGCRKSLQDYLTIEPIIDARRGAIGHRPERLRPRRHSAGRQRQRLAAVPRRPQASRLAGQVGAAPGAAGDPRRYVGPLAGRGRDRLTVESRTNQTCRDTSSGSTWARPTRALAYADVGDSTDEVVTVTHLPIPQVVGVNDVSDRPLLPSFLYLPAPKDFPDGALAAPLEVAVRSRRRHVRARPRREGAGPAGQLGQELALARGRRPPGRHPALDGRRGRRQGLAGRRVGRLSRAPPRRLECPRSPARRPPTASRTRRSS